MPSDRAIDVALDKHLTLELASRLGVPVPDSVLIRSLDSATIFEPPTVLKPVRSKVIVDGELVTLAPVIAADHATRDRMLRAWLPNTPVLEQRWVPGQGVGIEMLYEHGVKLWHFAHHRRHEIPLTGGASSYRCSMLPPPRLLEAAERLLTDLAWHGVAMVEFRLAPEGAFWLMEINPRLWGSLALAIDAGVDFPKGLLALARGERPGDQPPFKIGHFTRNVSHDVEWFKQNLRANRKDPVLLTVPIGRALIEPLRILIGKESWDHFDPLDPKVGWEILSSVATGQLGTLGKKLARSARSLHMARRHRRLFEGGGLSSNTVRRVLVLCYGNICRSPAAEAIAKRLLRNHEVSSAGLHPREGRSTPEHVRRVASKRGLDLAGHRSRRINAEDLERADLVLVMDFENLDGLLAEYPAADGKTTLLGLFDPQAPEPSIPDPYLLGDEGAEKVLDRVQAAVRGLANWLEATPLRGSQPGMRRHRMIDSPSLLAAEPGRSGLAVSVVDRVSDLQGLRAEWDDLLHRSREASPFLSWDWQDAWWRAYGKSHALRIYTVRRDGRLVAILPLYREQVIVLPGLTCRRLRFVGTGGDTSPDYLGALLDPDHEAEAAIELSDGILSSSDWDALWLSEVRVGSPFVAALEERATRRKLRLHAGPVTHITILPLSGSWDGLLANLDRHWRQEVRRRRRRLDELGGRCAVWKDPATLDGAFDRLAELHRLRWSGRAERHAFSSPEYLSFHREVMHRFLERGWLRLFVLEVGGEAIAMRYCFRFQDEVFAFQSGFDPAYGRLSPGSVLMGHVVEQSIHEGAQLVDMLKGEHPHKEAWSREYRETTHLRLYRMTPPGVLQRLRERGRPATARRVRSLLGLGRNTH